jgi:hypothetical protein
MIGWVAPVARIASTIACMPTAVYVAIPDVGTVWSLATGTWQPPSRQQLQLTGKTLEPNGSLNTSNTTPGSPRKVSATDVQKATE